MEQVSRAAHTGVPADALEDSPARWVEPDTPLVGKHCDEAGDVSFCPCRLQKVFSCNLKGLSPVTCEIIWSYISAEPYVGQIFWACLLWDLQLQVGFQRSTPHLCGRGALPVTPQQTVIYCRRTAAVDDCVVPTVEQGGGSDRFAPQHSFSSWLGSSGKGRCNVL